MSRAYWICFFLSWVCPLFGQNVEGCKPIGFSVNTEFAEDSPSISPDGKYLLFLRSHSEKWPEYLQRIPYQVNLQDSSRHPQRIQLFDSVYTTSFGMEKGVYFFTKRILKHDSLGLNFFVLSSHDSSTRIENLTQTLGLKASYVHQVHDGSIYYYQYEGSNGEGLYKSIKVGDKFSDPEWLGETLSEKGSTSFDAYVSPKEDWMVYTSFFESEKDKHKSGFYFAQKINDVWVKQKIKNLTYGWGATFTSDFKYFIYTDGNTIFQCSVDHLGLKYFSNQH